MPSLDNLQSELGDENFQVIIVSVERTPFSKVEDFLREINIKNLKNYHDPTTMVGKHINAKGLPITILFDKNGKPNKHATRNSTQASKKANHKQANTHDGQTICLLRRM